MKFLKNAWYPAAWDHEIGEHLSSRTLLQEPVLMYRKRNGQAVALSDRCPHRFAPLHMGRLVDDLLECPYHGLVFDCSGARVENPHGEGKIPRAARLKRYPLLEKYGLLWIWTGEPEKADPSRLPAFEQIVDSSKPPSGATPPYRRITSWWRTIFSTSAMPSSCMRNFSEPTRCCAPVAPQNLIRADSLVVSTEFRDGTAAGMPAVLRNGGREAAILLLANHGRTREDWLFGANRAMCLVPGEVRVT